MDYSLGFLFLVTVLVTVLVTACVITAKLLHMLSIQSPNLSDKCHVKQVSEERVKSRIRILLQLTSIYLYTYLTFVNKYNYLFAKIS